MAAFSQPITSHQLKRRGKKRNRKYKWTTERTLAAHLSTIYPWPYCHQKSPADCDLLLAWPALKSVKTRCECPWWFCELHAVPEGHSVRTFKWRKEKKLSGKQIECNRILFIQILLCRTLHICIVYSVEKLNGSSRPGGQSSRTLTKLAPSAQKDKQTKWTNRQTEWQMDRVG